MLDFTIEITGEPCRLDDCPPGPFLFEGRLGFRSEYWTSSIKPDAYCMDSGEFFWGGTDSTMKRAALMVQPIAIRTLAQQPAPAAVEGDGCASPGQSFDKSNCLKCGNNPHAIELCDDCEREFLAQLAAARLREALRRYGKHERGCDNEFGGCSCGFDATLADLDDAK